MNRPTIYEDPEEKIKVMNQQCVNVIELCKIAQKACEEAIESLEQFKNL